MFWVIVGAIVVACVALEVLFLKLIDRLDGWRNEEWKKLEEPREVQRRALPLWKRYLLAGMEATSQEEVLESPALTSSSS